MTLSSQPGSAEKAIRKLDIAQVRILYVGEQHIPEKKTPKSPESIRVDRPCLGCRLHPVCQPPSNGSAGANIQIVAPNMLSVQAMDHLQANPYCFLS